VLTWVYTHCRLVLAFPHPCHHTGDAQPMPEALGHSHSSLQMRMFYTKLGPVLPLRAPPGYSTSTLG
jgi:hypothetical protein